MTEPDIKLNDDIVEKIENDIKKESNKKALKIVSKNKREISRLLKHANDAVLDNNYDAYRYAIVKLRQIYKQPFTEEIIQVGWQTTRQLVWEIVNGSYSNKV